MPTLMNKQFIYFVLSVFLIASCGTEKVVTEHKQSVSKADYPYIQSFHEGLRLKTKGRLPEAIQKFEYCLTIRQDDDAVYYALSKLEVLQGNLDKSAQYILRAAEIDPTNTWYIQELAYMYLEKEDYPNAVVNFKKLVEIEPKSIEWLYGYAEALVNNGKEKEAIEALNKAEDQTGKHPQFSIQRFQLYFDMKDFESAEKELIDARIAFPKDANVIANLVDFYFKTDRTEDGIKMLKELVIADPGNGRAHLALADFYQQSGDLVKTYEELTLAFESPQLDVETKATILISVHKSGQTIDPEMYDLLKILVDMHPDNAIVYSVQGDYRLTANDEEGALKAYQKSLSIDGGEYPIWNQVMIMEYQAGQYENLYKHSLECLELFPTIPTVYLLNGLSANQLKKYDEAIDLLSVGVEVIIDDKPLKAEFYGQIGEAHFGKKEYSEGVINYKKGIKMDPQSLLIKNNFAKILALSKHDLDLALSMAEQIIAASPKNAIYHDTYGLVLFYKGEFEDARSRFELAMAFNGYDGLIQEHLGDALFKLGEKDEAVEYWKVAKKLGSNNKALDKKIAEGKYYDPID